MNKIVLVLTLMFPLIASGWSAGQIPAPNKPFNPAKKEQQEDTKERVVILNGVLKAEYKFNYIINDRIALLIVPEDGMYSFISNSIMFVNDKKIENLGMENLRVFKRGDRITFGSEKISIVMVRVGDGEETF